MTREYTIEMIQGTTVMEKMRNLIKLVVEFMNTMDSQSVEAEREERIQADELLQTQIDTLRETKQDVLTWDDTPTEGSLNPVTSGGIKSYVDGHTVNLDTEMSDTSENAVMNRVIKAYVDEHIPTLDSEMSDTSENAVMNKVIKQYVDSARYVKLSSDTAQTIYSELAVRKGNSNVNIGMELFGRDTITLDSPTTNITGEEVRFFSGISGREEDQSVSFEGSVHANYQMYVPDTPKGSRGEYAVNSDRLMAELQDIPTVIDDEMSDTSENPVQNKVIKQYVDSETVQKNLGSAQSQEIEGGIIVDESLQVPGIFVVDQTQGQTVINTPKGETGVKIVNENRLMDELADKQDVLTFDDFPTSASDNPVKSGGVYFGMSQLNESISQINNELVSLQTTKQDKMSSTAPIKITSNDISIEMDTTPTQNSKKPVTSGGLKTQFNNVASDITTLSNLITGKLEKSTAQGNVSLDSGQNVLGLELNNTKLTHTASSWQICLNFYASGTMLGRLIVGTETNGVSHITQMVKNADGSDKYVQLARGD